MIEKKGEVGEEKSERDNEETEGNVGEEKNERGQKREGKKRGERSRLKVGGQRHRREWDRVLRYMHFYRQKAYSQTKHNIIFYVQCFDCRWE